MTVKAPSPGWAVALRGHEFDLAAWEQRLKPPFDPWIEVEQRTDEEKAYLLRSRSFEGTASSHALRAAVRPMLEWLNGAIVLETSGEPVLLGPVVFYEADGRRKRFLEAEGIQFTARVSATITMTLTRADGTVVELPEPAPSNSQAAFKLAMADDDIADLLEHFSRSATDWYEIYKTLEAAKRIAKRFVPSKGAKDKKKDAFKVVFASRLAEFELTWRTANCYRHSQSDDHPLPTDPPPLGTARGLVTWVVREAIERAQVYDRA